MTDAARTIETTSGEWTAPVQEQAPLHLLLVGAGTPESLDLLHPLNEWMRDAGVATHLAPDFPRGARALVTDRWDAILLLLADRANEELTWWADAVRQAPGTPRLIVLSERASLGLAILAERVGALDVMPLPFQPADARRVVGRLRVASEERQIELPDPEPETIGPYKLVGKHPSMHEIYRAVAQVASSSATVLVQGASGTGKEVVARSIHVHGPRARAPFVAVNCAAIPENLLESELFGHEAGAFTGAIAARQGKFELATRGTLFLDEIGDMSLALQAKILRAVQEREVERVGGTSVIPVDVRVIAATNHDLTAAIAAGRFREDLYYRLAVVTLHLPALSARGDDLLLLASHYVATYGERYGKSIRWISDRALAALRRHTWPGNIRELRNVIERAVIVASTDTLRVEHLPDTFRVEELAVQDAPLPGRAASPLATLAEVEARHIARVLAQTGGAIGSAADILGIHRNTLTRKMKEYDL